MLILYQKVRFSLTRKSADLKFLFFFFLKTFFYTFSSPKTYTVNEFNYFCPTVLKVKRIKDCDSIIYPLFSCGGLTRTDDLWVMSPTSYQLLHSAMLCLITSAKVRLFSLTPNISRVFFQFKICNQYK